MTKTLDLDSLVLGHGSHPAPNNGLVDACVMEAVAYMAGERWSDSPECASPVLGAFLRSWNDSLPDDERQQLKRYIPLLVGTRGTREQEDARTWMALDWLVREHTPAWLRLAGLTDQADRLAGLPEFVAGMDVPSIRPTIDAVRKDAAAARAAARAAAGAAAGAAAWDAAWAAAWAAARDAARDAAWAAAWVAAWVAARAAAWAAARDAARDAAWDAAWAAARAAAGAAARDAARDAAWDAAWAAAWAAARDAARDAAGDAAWAAAGDALRPTRDLLIESAHGLVERMIAVTAPVDSPA